MTFKGYGTSQPIHPIPEKTEQEENENRRVEILIVEK
jgi:outer membrane protein OmpA-like peptidoglycan-associated protein